MNVWLNGHILALEKAHISPLDRGFLFGDGIYEVVRFFDRTGMAMNAHIQRLERSLQLTHIKGFDAHTLPALCEQLLQAEHLRDACVYLQITRGVAATRAHMPPDTIQPTVFALAHASSALDTLTTAAPISLSVQPDHRWHRCEIKCTSLMGSILPMLEGRAHAAQEAILVRDGFVSEGSSSNIFIAHGNTISTPPIDTDPSILHGTMRTLAMDAAKQLGFEVSIRPIEESELATADEIWVTGSSRVLASCVALNGKVFGSGKPAKMACAVINGMRLAVENLLVKTP
ncbi:MAG: D-amino acid aminotransferase [Phycisphaerales bacterium]|nr:D-amino acid aminotransferase [Phycisphaerales bacterium]